MLTEIYMAVQIPATITAGIVLLVAHHKRKNPKICETCALLIRKTNGTCFKYKCEQDLGFSECPQYCKYYKPNEDAMKQSKNWPF